MFYKPSEYIRKGRKKPCFFCLRDRITLPIEIEDKYAAAMAYQGHHVAVCEGCDAKGMDHLRPILKRWAQLRHCIMQYPQECQVRNGPHFQEVADAFREMTELIGHLPAISQARQPRFDLFAEYYDSPLATP